MVSRTCYRLIVLTTAGVLAVAGTGVAQTVRIGDKLQMIDTGGRERTGIVRGVETSVLTVAVNGIDERWPAADMRELWREGDSLRNGLIIGALAGAAGGVYLGLGLASIAETPIGDRGGMLAGTTALGIGIGAAAGAGIDALVRGRTLLYRQGHATLSVTPVVTPGTKAVRLALRF